MAVGSEVAPSTDWTGINWACVEDAVGLGVGGSVGLGVGGSVGLGVGGSVGLGVGQAPPAQAAELLLLWSEAQRTNSVVTDAGVESELAPACIRTVVGLVNAASPAHWMWKSDSTARVTVQLWTAWSVVQTEAMLGADQASARPAVEAMSVANNPRAATNERMRGVFMVPPASDQFRLPDRRWRSITAR
jgi:hypothetical protein